MFESKENGCQGDDSSAEPVSRCWNAALFSIVFNLFLSRIQLYMYVLFILGVVFFWVDNFILYLTM